MLKKLLQNNFILVIASSVVSIFALMYLNYLLLFVSLVPTLYVIYKSTTSKNIANGILFGVVLATSLYYWMFSSFVAYTEDESIFLAIGFIVLSIVCIAIFYGLLFACVSFAFKTTKSSKYLWLQSIVVASVWSLLEMFLPIILIAYPFHAHQFGTVLSKNIFSIQWASLGGTALLTFFVILINAFLASAIFNQKKKYAVVSLVFVFVLFSGGFLLKSFLSPLNSKKTFKVSSVSGNFSTKDFWNQNKVNQLATDYFQLIAQVNQEKPDFVIFPESAFPWTYFGKDDLLNEFHKRLNPDTALVLGLNSTQNLKDTIVKNKVFYFKEGKELGSYQKEILIKGIESPIANLVAPFAHNSNYIVEKTKEKNQLFNTPYGKAGVLICNESVVASHAIQQAKNGANFFFNTSNDSWFKDTYITRHHLYQSRLLSVITRKDMVVSNNTGYNAIIKSTGEILKLSKKDYKSIITGNIEPNNSTTFQTRFPYLFAILLIIFLFMITMLNKNNLINSNKKIPISN
ncbi:apolipoprotein N-acyltransferase [uncultured Polaribacter sp.]|uniref:apolipoprotein N-acyltransferase n=1 Tax=uncultured Polaribacter sp. TaxID=174711 RepID=UPI0026365D83|nr:apolipoprotein N-acyltransferase [uncultured Polaribacter sp.]